MTTTEDIAVLQRIAASLSADLMDGGVTCAAIENETDEKPTAYWEGIYRGLRDDADNAHTMAALWKETAREHIGRAEVYQEWMRAAQTKDENSHTWAAIAKKEAERANKAERGWTQANNRNARQAEMLDDAERDLAKAECHDCIRDAEAEFDRFIARVRRDAARSALDGLLKHIGHPTRPSPMIGPGGLQHYIRANHPEETP